MQTVLHMQGSREAAGRGKILCSENGARPACTVAFSREALVGFHLFLPRRLGTSSVALILSADGVGEVLTLPLSWGGLVRGMEKYNALLDMSALARYTSFFTYRIVLQTAHGCLYAHKKEGGEIAFFHTPPMEENGFCLYISHPAYALPAHFAGGAFYALNPISQHTGSPILEEKGVLSHLVRLGVNALWLAPNRTGRENLPWRADRILTPSFCRFVKEHGISLYPDLWLAAGISGSIASFLQEGESCATAQGMGEAPPECCGASPTLTPHTEKRPICDRFCGPDGIVAEWMHAGADGFFVRAADGVGDAFLGAVREKIANEGGHALFGLLHAHKPGGIAFGVRRRFFFGEEFDGAVTASLHTALLSYFANGKTDALRAFFTEELCMLPPTVLHMSLNAISHPERRFFDALPKTEEREALTALAYLTSATLPGCPLILAGDEWGGGEENTENAMYAYYLRVGRLRKKEAVYRDGSVRLLLLSEHELVFSREREGEALLTVINRQNTPLFLSGDFTVLFGGRGRKTQFILPPFCGAVCRVSLWQGERERLYLSRTQPLDLPVQSAVGDSEILHFATHGCL